MVQLVALCAIAALPPAESARDPRCFEIRTYYAEPGKLDGLNARFRTATVRLFRKHGIENIGYWMPVDNAQNKMVYVIACPSQEARDASFAAFVKDPDWQKAARESEANGKLVTRITSQFLTATDYSPAIRRSSARGDRLFEMRIYTAAPGKLDALNARVRDNTVRLFRKHGMTSIGYWTPTGQEQGMNDTLIYLLAHKSREAADKSWREFGQDPEWTRVRTESERDGRLVDKAESIYMTPTDYSPIK